MLSQRAKKFVRPKFILNENHTRRNEKQNNLNDFGMAKFWVENILESIFIGRANIQPNGTQIAVEKNRWTTEVEFSKMKRNPKILESEVLLGFVSHRAVAWGFVKLFTAYKYLGFLV